MTAHALFRPHSLQQPVIKPLGCSSIVRGLIDFFLEAREPSMKGRGVREPGSRALCATYRERERERRRTARLMERRKRLLVDN